MEITREEFERLIAQVDQLRVQAAGPNPGPSDEQRRHDADQENQRRALAQATAQAKRAELTQIALAKFGLQEGQSSQSHPRGLVPAAPANPFPRPRGVSNLSGRFSILQTSYGQAFASGLGAKLGYFAELEAWVPLISALWDVTSELLSLVIATDAPDAVVVTVKLWIRSGFNGTDRKTPIYPLTDK